jgi:hypothetical protein
MNPDINVGMVPGIVVFAPTTFGPVIVGPPNRMEWPPAVTAVATAVEVAWYSCW